MKREYVMKKILVTGSEGFIGSHLVEKLVMDGFRVRAFIQYNFRSDKGWLKNLESKNVEFFFGDIRDYDSVLLAFHQVDIVIHLAALISIPHSYDTPYSFIDTNVKGTYNILEASRKNTIERVLITSTSEVYGSAITTPMNEHHPLQAQSPYAATKIAADRLAESYYKSFGVPVTIVRPFNTFGPRQSTRAIIPRVITQLLRNPLQVKLGSLFPIRDFNFVEDVVDAFISILNTDAAIGQEINIASGNGISIADVVDIIAKEIGIKYKIVEVLDRVRPELSEVDRLIGDASKLKNLTGWSAKHNFVSGLRKTIEFYQSNHVEMDDYIK
jgi:NAD dependent epimerase/dehydratase